MEETTLEVSGERSSAGELRVPALTLLHHPDPRRVGERARLTDLAGDGEVEISRLTPRFAPPFGGGMGEPLTERVVSRSPLRLRRRGGELSLRGEKIDARIDGHVLATAELRLPVARLASGVVLELGPRVVLLLHELGPPGPAAPRHGLIGEGEALEGVRQAISRGADISVPVLLRGESGTGKELVARALHAAGTRRDGPMIAVNMAAVSEQTAVSLLFGHVRGAFTGAVADHRGYFQAADGGTLFLDEIGELPVDVQAMLLRVLEQGEVQPLGAARSARVDVRVIAATDSDLEALVARGAFRPALLHRLAGYTLAIPPLRERRDDLGRLLHHFLREELALLGEPAHLDQPAARPWLGGELVAAMARHSWPGNVRELRNVARQIAISSRGRDRAVLDASIKRLLTSSQPELSPSMPAAVDESRGEEISAERIHDALERNGHRMAAAAAALGVSRTRLYALAERLDGVRTGADLSAGEIEQALHAAGGKPEAAAAALRVSRRALILRMRALGLGPLER
jgi:two-component system, NtrC family, nitrogen regulation response regulator GlnG